MVDGTELFTGLHFNEGLDSAVVCRHLQHGSAQVPQGGIEAGDNPEGGARKAVRFECRVVCFVEADVLTFVALVDSRCMSAGRARSACGLEENIP